MTAADPPRPTSLPASLLIVTDRHGAARPLRETVAAILRGGGRWFWFRERDMPPGPRRALAREVLGIVRDAGGRLTVGADLELAVAIGADGVHLPGGTRPDAVVRARRLLRAADTVGVSAHGFREAEAAADAGADYVTLSPIFATASKPGYGPALGVEALRAARGLAAPVVALGGVTPDNADACLRAGAAGVAVMGSPMRAADPARVVRDFLTSIRPG